MPELLTVSALTKTFGVHTAVDAVSLHVPSGHVVGLLGPNGSGKSTALHCLAGLIRPTSGIITIAGIPHEEPEAKNALGFFPDDLPMPDSLTADETLAFNRRLRPTLDLAFAELLMEHLDLAGHRRKMLGDYSHGMRRKLQLVLALAHHPRVLILDEPLRGLDPEAAALMNAVMTGFSQSGGGVLIATHDLLAAERYCDQVVVISDGHVIAEGSPRSVASGAGADSLQDAFIQVTGLRDRVARATQQMHNLFEADVATQHDPALTKG